MAEKQLARAVLEFSADAHESGRFDPARFAELVRLAIDDVCSEREGVATVMRGLDNAPDLSEGPGPIMCCPPNVVGVEVADSSGIPKSWSAPQGFALNPVFHRMEYRNGKFLRGVSIRFVKENEPGAQWAVQPLNEDGTPRAKPFVTHSFHGALQVAGYLEDPDPVSEALDQLESDPPFQRDVDERADRLAETIHAVCDELESEARDEGESSVVGVVAQSSPVYPNVEPAPNLGSGEPNLALLAKVASVDDARRRFRTFRKPEKLTQEQWVSLVLDGIHGNPASESLTRVGLTPSRGGTYWRSAMRVVEYYNSLASQKSRASWLLMLEGLREPSF